MLHQDVEEEDDPHGEEAMEDELAAGHVPEVGDTEGRTDGGLESHHAPDEGEHRLL